MSIEKQVMILYAGTRGYVDQIPLDSVKNWETGMLRFMETNHPEIGRSILEHKRITDATEKQLVEALKGYNLTWNV
jgi:F-type H+-transporting ATPase subunit alpha